MSESKVTLAPVKSTLLETSKSVDCILTLFTSEVTSISPLNSTEGLTFIVLEPVLLNVIVSLKKVNVSLDKTVLALRVKLPLVSPCINLTCKFFQDVVVLPISCVIWSKGTKFELNA